MPLQSTSGAASYDAFGGGAAAKVNYIEDFFQSYLRTGTGASATVTTGLDGSTKETLVWTKSRSAATNHKLTDNVRGATKALSSNTTGAEATDSQGLMAFSATGYTIGTNTDYNNSGATYVDWQWVAQPKFFDVVTFTGTGSLQTIAHNLGSVPGCIIIKSIDTAGLNWRVYHRAIGNTGALNLVDTSATSTSAVFWNNTSPTSTEFTVNTNSSVNGSGFTYVAYLFAHDAGGFGLTGTDNVISCGTYTGTGATQSISLGYEAQWVLVKASNNTDNWKLVDAMRVGDGRLELRPNTTAAETVVGEDINFNSTGFLLTGNSSYNLSGINYIYIAIRRGPMKVPTDATSVFSPQTATYSTNQVVTTGFPVDMLMMKGRTITLGTLVYDRLRGLASTNTSPYDAQLFTSDTSAETAGDYTNTANNTGYQISAGFSGFSSVNYNFRRAPSFFDEVCYTGTGSARTLTHNLGVVPELMIVKRRSASANWAVYSAALGATFGGNLNLSDAFTSAFIDFWNDTTPTSSVFSVGTDGETNLNGQTYVAYLFATCAGVSKVGSYTGTATTLQVDCGFTGGARFVLIKRTDSTGSWYVWDSSRGIVSGNDPYLLLNSTAAEVTNTDYIDTYSAGFEISSTAPAEINASGGSFIFLAIS